MSMYTQKHCQAEAFSSQVSQMFSEVSVSCETQNSLTALTGDNTGSYPEHCESTPSS